jgi:hypothetical protein
MRGAAAGTAVVENSSTGKMTVELLKFLLTTTLLQLDDYFYILSVIELKTDIGTASVKVDQVCILTMHIVDCRYIS